MNLSLRAHETLVLFLAPQNAAVIIFRMATEAASLKREHTRSFVFPN